MNDPIKGILLEAVETASGHSRLIDDLELTALLSEEVSDNKEITNPEVREILKSMNGEDDLPVCVLSGKERLRCFDSAKMSLSYAEALNLAAEGNSLEIIAQTVRKESRLYPRPSMVEMFLHSPYNMEAQVLEYSLQALVSDNTDYKDICRSGASNGDIYLYSDRYLNQARADYLSEWESVGSLESQ